MILLEFIFLTWSREGDAAGMMILLGSGSFEVVVKDTRQER